MQVYLIAILGMYLSFVSCYEDYVEVAKENNEYRWRNLFNPTS